MARIHLKNIGVRFPNYDATARSMKRRIIHSMSGGDLMAESVVHPFVEALGSIDISLSPGDRLALLGGNGAGKTTLIRVLAGLLSPSQGTADITGTPFAFFNHGFGYAVNESVADYIILRGIMHGLSFQAARDKADGILGSAHLAEHACAPVKTLSAGMALRLMFETEIQLETDIFLFDEILEACSPNFLNVIATHLTSSRYAETIAVMAERSRPILDGMCNKALVLDKGTVVDFGDYAAVIARHGAKLTY